MINRKKGITLVEIMVVIAVLGVLFSVVLPSVNSSSYGVHLESDKVIIFKGTAFSSGDADNETIDIIAPANISNVTLAGVSGSTGNVYFNRLSGGPNKTGTITISTTNFSKIITISATGGASVN